MPALHRKTLNPLAVAALGAALLLAPGAHAAAGVPAQFRGCDAAGWCRFWIEPDNALAEPLHRVRPRGIPEMRGADPVSIGVRDRLNALLSSFVHQHKRIMLYGLRGLDDGTWTANITVNESPLEADATLRALAAQRR